MEVENNNETIFLEGYLLVKGVSVLWAILIILVGGAVVVSEPSAVWSAEPGTAAMLDGEPVTRDELERMLADPVVQSQFEQAKGSGNATGKERFALEKLIERRLILREARSQNITVSEQDVDMAIASLRRSFPDIRSFGAWMKERGLDDRSLFGSVREDMLVKRSLAVLAERVRVTDEQVKEYYEAHNADLKTEEVWIQIIAVKDRTTAEDIQKALRKGEDFGRLARQHSVGMRAAQGGDAGWVDAGSLWLPLREAVRTLKPGEAIGPLQRGAEFLIVRLEERRTGRSKTLEEARPEIERVLLFTKQREAIETWLTEKKEKTKIEMFLDPK